MAQLKTEINVHYFAAGYWEPGGVSYKKDTWGILEITLDVSGPSAKIIDVTQVEKTNPVAVSRILVAYVNRGFPIYFSGEAKESLGVWAEGL